MRIIHVFKRLWTGGNPPQWSEGVTACGMTVNKYEITEVIADHKAPHMCGTCVSRQDPTKHTSAALVGPPI